MRFVKKFSAAIAGLAMLAALPSGPAVAADNPPFVPNWSGATFAFFSGIDLGGLGSAGTIGVGAGYSFSNGRLVFGGDVALGVATAIAFIDVRARVGALVRPRFLAYLTAGAVFAPGIGGGLSAITAGGGLEFAIVRDLSVFVETTALRIDTGGPTLWLPIWNIGINWRPGN